MSAPLETRVRRGFLWSLTGNATLRLGTLVTGILLARILSPAQFGVYAIALTVQTILMTMSELGLAADLVRHGQIEDRGPTVTTLSLVSSTSLTAVMCLTARPVATALGSAGAAPVIQVLSVTLLLAGIGVVPYARLQRGLRQAALFLTDVVSFVITTALTVVLALAGWGPMALAVGRVAAQVVATALQFVLTRDRPRIGWDRAVAVSGLRFSVPLAGAGLLTWVLLSLDNVVVGRSGGAVLLGLYVLAFNISSWPTTVVGTAIRAVAMPAFAQRTDAAGQPDADGLRTSTALTWVVALPIGLALATLADPLIRLVYGERWVASAAALAGLAFFGSLRVVFDLWVAYLTAAGRGVVLLWTQGLWIVLLAPAMWWGVRNHQLAGAGWAHLVVAGGLMLPVNVYALRRTGAPVRQLVVPAVLPAVAAVPAYFVGRTVARMCAEPWQAVVLGGLAIGAVYLLVLWPMARHVLPADLLRRLRVPGMGQAALAGPSSGVHMATRSLRSPSTE